MAIVIGPERPDSPDALALVAELEDHLEPLYPAVSRHGLNTEQLLQQEVAFFVVRQYGVAAGCGGIRLFGCKYGELKRMFMRPAFRGQGLGRRLVEHLVWYARRHEVPVVRLETGIHQHEAMRLYGRCGFETCGPFGHYTDDPLSRYYELRLA